MSQYKVTLKVDRLNLKPSHAGGLSPGSIDSGVAKIEFKTSAEDPSTNDKSGSGIDNEFDVSVDSVSDNAVSVIPSVFRVFQNDLERFIDNSRCGYQRLSELSLETDVADCQPPERLSEERGLRGNGRL